MSSDFWKDAGDVLATVAPTLASAIGGPLAGTGVAFVLKTLGLAPETTKEQLAPILANATPEQLKALSDADHEFAEHMSQLKIDVTKLAYDDTKDARDLQKVNKSYTPSIMGGFIVACAMAFSFLVLMGYAKADSALAGTVLGLVISEAKQVVSFIFGSTASSEDAQAMLFKSTPIN